MNRLFHRARYWFFERFGERTIQRSDPAHGDWTETCGWEFRGRFFRRDFD